MLIRAVAAIFVSVALLLLPVDAKAADPQPKGLLVSPTRQDVTVSAGKVSDGAFKVSNFTEKPLTVNLSAEQFSVTSVTYTYKFSQQSNDMRVVFEKQQLALQPGQSAIARYSIDVPAGATGGHYLALFASADMSASGAVKQTGKVASLLFLKIDGKIEQQGVIENDQVSFLNMNSSITYAYDAKNTGNAHYDARFYAELEGMFYKTEVHHANHVLMPDAVRGISGTISSPLLPGLYKLTFGYKSSASETIAQKSAYVLFIPPWFIIAVVILMHGIIRLWRRKLRGKSIKRSSV